MKYLPRFQNHLVFKKRFGPLFWALFLGALNDNFLKNALVIMITYKNLTVWGLPPAQMVALMGGVFILPFFLFSTLAGQISDKYEKSSIVRITKIAEILLMTVAAYGFLHEMHELLILALFLTGVQAAFFGPVKYSVLPQHLSSSELVEGNALVELGTFVAILIGTILGGILVSTPQGPIFVSVGLISCSLAGYVSASLVPLAPSFQPSLVIDSNPFKSFKKIIELTASNSNVLWCVIGISWFWFFGSVIISILPAYTKDTLYGNENVVEFFLALFTIGIATGSMVCSRLSFNRLELGHVPFGALFISLFTLDLASMASPYGPTSPMGILDFLAQPKGIRISFDLFMTSVASGFVIVPLYTLIQQRSEPSTRSRIVAGNNIINAFFMVVAAISLTSLLKFNFSIPSVLAQLALVHWVVMSLIFYLNPEFLIRSAAWFVARILKSGINAEENMPREGPAILVCHDNSWISWLRILGRSPRPIRFVISYQQHMGSIQKSMLESTHAIFLKNGNLNDCVALANADLEKGRVICFIKNEGNAELIAAFSTQSSIPILHI